MTDENEIRGVRSNAKMRVKWKEEKEIIDRDKKKENVICEKMREEDNNRRNMT